MVTKHFPDFHIILVPGLHDSGPGHWQTRWEQRDPALKRVRQADWDDPQLPVWAARLDQLRRADPRPALFIAHSYGCLTTVHSLARDGGNVAGALLVAPADPDKFGVAERLPALALPCPSILVSSSNDPWMDAGKAALWGRRWGSEVINAGPLGHINAESGLGDWPAGQGFLQRLLEKAHNERLAFSA